MGRKKGNKNKIKKEVTIPKDCKTISQQSEIPQIKAALKVMGRTCVAEGRTVQEVITNLKPEYTRGVGILTLEKGDIRKEKVIQPRIINNLFGKFTGRIGKERALKNVLLFFNGIFE